MLEAMGGEAAVKITKIYEKKGKKITDEEVAKKIKMKVTEVRTILNRMHYRGVSCYHRAKNSKTGWYSYSWEIKTRRILELLLEQHNERIEKLEKKKSFEENYALFSCKKNCDYIPFEIATEYLFKCPECGSLMEAVDNEKRMKGLDSQLVLLQKEREKIQKTL